MPMLTMKALSRTLKAGMTFDAIRLCQLVKNYPCLYDHEVVSYTSNGKLEMENAWREIGQEMNESWTECKTRWYNIRGSFSKQVNGRRASGTRAAVKAKYYLEDELAFLRPFMKNRKPLDPHASTSKNAVVEPNNSRYETGTCKRIKTEPEDESEELEERPWVAMGAPGDETSSCVPETEDCAEMYFLRSILPDLKRMNPEQQYRFRMTTLQTIGDILYS